MSNDTLFGKEKGTMESNLTKIQKNFILVSMLVTMTILSIGMSGVNSFKKEMAIPTSMVEYINLERVDGVLEEEYPLLPESWAANEIVSHIDVHDETLVNKVLEITNTTPLDEVTASIIVRYGKELDVPISLILSVIDVESEFNQFVVGAAEDRGYCQIIPSAEKWLTSNHGHKIGIEYDPSRIFEPEYNIGLGVLYIHLLSKAYDNDFHRVLSEYNRGPYNLEKYFNTHKTYQTNYSRMVLNNQQKYVDLQI